MNRSLLVLISLIATGLLGCQQPNKAPLSTQQRAMTVVGPNTTIRFLKSSQSASQQRVTGWHVYQKAGYFFTSPRWSPDGQTLVTSGWLGAGLYALRLRDQTLQTLHPSFVGQTRWTPAGELLLLPPKRLHQGTPTLRVPRLDLSRKQTDDVLISTHTEIDPEHKILRQILFQRAGRKVTYCPYKNQLKIFDDGVQVFEISGVWGVAVSKDGRHIAYSHGRFYYAELYAWLNKTPARYLGRGAHPTWSPDGQTLVYTRPEPQPDTQVRLQRADLYMFDVHAGQTRRLTWTGLRAEAQPAFSPDGETLACVDWRTGALLWASFSWLRR